VDQKKIILFFPLQFSKIPNISVNAVFDLKETIKLNKNDAENIKNWPKKNLGKWKNSDIKNN
jgi:hypothetical protein